MKKAKMRRRFCVWVVASGLVLSWSVLCTGDFYVIPVKSGGECTGDATVGDVLVGKTFSNSTATGLTGIRPPAPVEKTGQTGSEYPGDDGFHQKGVPWPVPRFTAGTNVVTDNLTGLMWTKSASNGAKDWNSAIAYCDGIIVLEPEGRFTLTYDDWRLPNVKELQSLIDFGHYGPALPPGHPFTGVQSYLYWSSTTYAVNPDFAWDVHLYYGRVDVGSKSFTNYVWPVRGGQ